MTSLNRPICCGKPMAKQRGKAESGRQRYTCNGKNGCGQSTTGSKDSLHARRMDSPGYDKKKAWARARNCHRYTKFVITAAQNNTAVHAGFLAALTLYCKRNRATLLATPLHYKNVSLYTANEEYEKWWDPAIINYLVDWNIGLGGNVHLRADISIAATAARPLEGKQAIGGSQWCIYGHSQVAMEPVASPGDELPKRMYTTGCVTVPNYSRTNFGAKAEFHHVISALVVEIDGDVAFIRQLQADEDGSFYDLDKLYTPTEVTGSHRALALTAGDEHVKFHKPEVFTATYGDRRSIVNTLRPHFIFRHDVLDGYAGSHHHESDDVLQFAKYHRRDHDYRAELDQAVRFINDTTPVGTKSYIVNSNHHDHLYKWLARVDPKKDHQNALLIHELKGLQYANALTGKTTDPFEIYAMPRFTVDCEFLDPNKPHIIEGVDYSQHGHLGTNGSKGSARLLARTTHKMIIGHAHSARIVQGVYQVGTSTGRLDYQKGLSDWTNTHCIQYANGKRTLIDIMNGKWRA